MNRIGKFFSLILLFGSSFQALATLELELTQGMDGAIPMAISPFEMAEKALAQCPSLSKVAEVIHDDLSHSGRFKLLPNRQGKNTVSTTLNDWRKRGVDDVLTGKITTIAHQFVLAYRVQQTHGRSFELLRKTVPISCPSWRRVAHQISDDVYQLLTGDKGYFSTRIAYVVDKSLASHSHFALEVADADGQNARTLFESAQPIMSPSWSSNGSEIAFVSFEQQRSAIYRINVATRKRTLVTAYPGINGAPKWSPDDRHLAIVLSKSGVAKLYLFTLKDKTLRQLTHGWSIDTEPSWSPDGQSLLFTSNRGGSPQVYRLSLSSGHIERLSYTGNYNAHASYTPDGRNIVLQHRDQRKFSIAVQNLDSGYLQVLTDSGTDESPTVAPNGNMILYAARVGDKRLLNFVSIDGKVHVRLPALSGQVQEPAWSPIT